jgi:hypothetical protein
VRKFSEYHLVDELNMGKRISRDRIDAEVREIQESIAEDVQAITDAEALVRRLMTSLEAQRRELRALRAVAKEAPKGA